MDPLEWLRLCCLLAQYDWSYYTSFLCACSRWFCFLLLVFSSLTSISLSWSWASSLLSAWMLSGGVRCPPSPPA